MGNRSKEKKKQGALLQTKRKTSPMVGVLCMLVLCLCFSTILSQTVLATGSMSLNQKKKTLVVGDTYQLKISGTKKKVKWSSSNSSVVKVSRNGLITAKKKGTAVVKAKVGTRTYRCDVTVVHQQTANINKTIKAINFQRRRYGRVSLKKNEYLQKAAQKRAKELSVKFSAAKRPNGSYWTSAISMKYNYKASPAEVIARECATVDSVVSVWMNRADTQRAILRKQYRDIGVGYYIDDFGTSYWVVILGNR